jgi:hypothetical protein
MIYRANPLNLSRIICWWQRFQFLFVDFRNVFHRQHRHSISISYQIYILLAALANESDDRTVVSYIVDEEGERETDTKN